ncbi:MAG: SRPBCC domain-containing protein [Saprospiraceae bacterium]
MRFLILTIILNGFCMALIAQVTPKETNNKKTMKYYRQASDVKGKRTAFTEIEINASPEIVRSKFLQFEKWSEWNTVIPEIAVKSGNLSDLSTKPTLDLMLNFGRKGDPAKAPVFPSVYDNNEEVFNWGFRKGVFISAEHVFIFESINNGKGTRLIHYEKMKGMLKAFIMTKKTKANMIEKYNNMNKGFKTFCEKS